MSEVIKVNWYEVEPTRALVERSNDWNYLIVNIRGGMIKEVDPVLLIEDETGARWLCDGNRRIVIARAFGRGIKGVVCKVGEVLNLRNNRITITKDDLEGTIEKRIMALEYGMVTFEHVYREYKKIGLL